MYKVVELRSGEIPLRWHEPMPVTDNVRASFYQNGKHLLEHEFTALVSYHISI
jgi:hypothetical protein